MAQQDSRYLSPAQPSTAEGWTLQRITGVSRLYGANGMQIGKDGRIYVAQVAGSQISAVDIDTGLVEAISAMGGDIVAPDDLAFDEEGNLYATEITESRVAMMTPNGKTRVIQGDMPVANPITYHQGMLIAGECRMDARIMELDRDGGAPRIIAQGIPMANAFQVGPDGKLYFPVMGANEIWRVSLEGGEPERVAGELGVPDSVKFDPEGYIVSTQVGSGQVLRIDPRTGDKQILAQLTPGLDNCVFSDGRLFVSNMTGYIVEILKDGRTRNVVPDGFTFPMGLAMGEDGILYICDGGFSYKMRPGSEREIWGNFFSPNYPGYARGVAAVAPGEYIVATGTGDVARFWPEKQESEVLASGYDQLYDVAVAANGGIVFVEMGAGKVHAIQSGSVEELASGLDKPKGVAIGADGTIYVSESGAGRIVKLKGGKAETVVDGLGVPQGIAAKDETLLIVDAGSKSVIEYDLGSGARRTIAADLPVGTPPGVIPKPIGAIKTFSGPMGNFAAIAVGGDGTLYVSGDAEGSVLQLSRG